MNSPSPSPTATLAGLAVGDGHPVRLMGVINVSPESFFKGSVASTSRAIGRAARQIAEAGADFIDVGAMSSAPYLDTHIPEREEARRLAAAVAIVKNEADLPISADTFRAGPAEAALAAGARILNDITGLKGDPAMGALARHAEGLILMAHPARAQGAPKGPVKTVIQALREALAAAQAHKIPPRRLVLDPGIGFFRKMKIPWWKWDVAVLGQLADLKSLERPLLVGVSRKSFIGQLLGGAPPDERLAGSLAAAAIAVLNGANIIRTHDVAETKQAIRVAEALKGGARDPK